MVVNVSKQIGSLFVSIVYVRIRIDLENLVKVDISVILFLFYPGEHALLEVYKSFLFLICKYHV